MRHSSLQTLFATALACAFGVPAQALQAPGEPLLWSQPASGQENCPDAESYLRLQLDTGDACLRYFGPSSLGRTAVMIVHFTGDRDQSLKLAPDQIKNNTAQAQTAIADRLSRRAGVPVVTLARPGTYGSSGNHRLRRRMAEEFAPLNAGLDALKRRYGVERFVLWGHSGGATAAAALLTMGRTDVRCAVLTSATFEFLERWRIRRSAGGPAPSVDREAGLARAMYDPLDHIDSIVRDSRRTVYVVGDPRDSVTPFDLQARFAQALQRAGHRAVLREVEGAPPTFHDLRDEAGFRQAVECA